MRKCVSLFILLFIAAVSSFVIASPATTISPAVSGNLDKVLKTCHCVNCDLQKTNLSGFKPGSNNEKDNPFVRKGKKLDSSCWMECDFSGANFTGANLSNSNFTTCIRGYVTPVTKINFSSAKLADTNLSQSTFIGVNFQAANLFRANLSQSKIYLSNFKKANLSYANLTRTISMVDAMHGWGTDFSLGNFTHANLSHANLYGNFQGADFSYAHLTGATLMTSPNVITDKNVSASGLWDGVNFSHVDLRDVKLKTLDGKLDLSKAILCETTMPDGKLNNRNCSKN